MPCIAELSRGEQARVVGFAEGSKGYRSKLLAMGLIPGTEFILKRIAPLGCPVELSVRGYSLSLRKNEASLLHIERLA